MLESKKADKIEKRNSFKYLIVLNVLLLLYSFSGVFSKKAGQYSDAFFEFCKALLYGKASAFTPDVRSFVLFYGGVFLLLGIYAIVWQQLLKHISLTTAFCNKAVTIVWGMLWGVLIFSETITWNMILGAGIVVAGVWG